MPNFESVNFASSSLGGGSSSNSFSSAGLGGSGGFKPTSANNPLTIQTGGATPSYVPPVSSTLSLDGSYGTNVGVSEQFSLFDLSRLAATPAKLSLTQPPAVPPAVGSEPATLRLAGNSVSNPDGKDFLFDSTNLTLKLPSGVPNTLPQAWAVTPQDTPKAQVVPDANVPNLTERTAFRVVEKASEARISLDGMDVARDSGYAYTPPSMQALYDPAQFGAGSTSSAQQVASLMGESSATQAGATQEQGFLERVGRQVLSATGGSLLPLATFGVRGGVAQTADKGLEGASDLAQPSATVQASPSYGIDWDANGKPVFRSGVEGGGVPASFAEDLNQRNATYQAHLQGLKLEGASVELDSSSTVHLDKNFMTVGQATDAVRSLTGAKEYAGTLMPDGAQVLLNRLNSGSDVRNGEFFGAKVTLPTGEVVPVDKALTYLADDATRLSSGAEHVYSRVSGQERTDFRSVAAQVRTAMAQNVATALDTVRAIGQGSYSTRAPGEKITQTDVNNPLAQAVKYSPVRDKVLYPNLIDAQGGQIFHHNYTFYDRVVNGDRTPAGVAAQATGGALTPQGSPSPAGNQASAGAGTGTAPESNLRAPPPAYISSDINHLRRFAEEQSLDPDNVVALAPQLTTLLKDNANAYGKVTQVGELYSSSKSGGAMPELGVAGLSKGDAVFSDLENARTNFINNQKDSPAVQNLVSHLAQDKRGAAAEKLLGAVFDSSDIAKRSRLFAQAEPGQASLKRQYDAIADISDTVSKFGAKMVPIDPKSTGAGPQASPQSDSVTNAFNDNMAQLKVEADAIEKKVMNGTLSPERTDTQLALLQTRYTALKQGYDTAMATLREKHYEEGTFSYFKFDGQKVVKWGEAIQAFGLVGATLTPLLLELYINPKKEDKRWKRAQDAAEREREFWLERMALQNRYALQQIAASGVAAAAASGGDGGGGGPLPQSPDVSFVDVG